MYCDTDQSNDNPPLQDAAEGQSRPQEIARKCVDQARLQSRENVITKRRFGAELEQEHKLSLNEILNSLKSSKFSDKSLLIRLKSVLANGRENPEEFFLSGCGEQNLHNLVNIMSTNGHEYQLLAIEILANLSPLSEKNGLKVARSAGPYLITLLSSSSSNLKEASSIAIANLALSGFKVVKVLLHQNIIQRLYYNLPEYSSIDQHVDINTAIHSKKEEIYNSKVISATLYALYHIIHTMDRPRFGTVEKGDR